MSPYPIGQQLRRLVLEDHRQGRELDPRRLQAAIGDLCGAEHSDLVAPLRYLVLSRAFASAASQEAPLSDGRRLQRLQDELAQMYAPTLCARLQPVLEGLLGLPPGPSGGPAASTASGGAAPRRTTPPDWSAEGGNIPAIQAGVPPTASGGWSEERRAVPRGSSTTTGSAHRNAGASRHDPGQDSHRADPSADTNTGSWPPADPGGYGATPAASPGSTRSGGAQGGAADPFPPSLSRSGGGSPLNTLLAFLCGMLLMALGGMALLLWQRHGGLPSAPSTSQVPVSPAAPPASTSAPQAGPRTPAPPNQATSETTAEPPGSRAEDTAATGDAGSAPSSDSAAVDRSMASIQELYGALSSKDFDRARSLFADAAADQFEPGFFRQFERVTVQDLQITSRSGSTVNLEGVVSFVYPDGSIQTETRSFSVDSSSDPARITASEFGRVIQPR